MREETIEVEKKMYELSYSFQTLKVPVNKLIRDI